MKSVLLILASILIVWFVWGLVTKIVGGLFGFVFPILMLGLFCYAVYLVYKALNRQKIM